MKAPSSAPNPILEGWFTPKGVQPAGAYFRIMRRLTQVVFCCLWKVRVFNRHYEPASGGVLYICNHQSFLDPMVMSMALRRTVNYMARDTLFRMPGFKQLITSVNAFPVKRGTADTGALKEAMRRLKSGGQVVVFAEGTRTLDGRIGPFLPGVALLAQRAAQWVVPVTIDGAFEAWPRTQMLPSPGNVVVQYAPAISQEKAKAMAGDELLRQVRAGMIDMQTHLRGRVGRGKLDY